MQGEVTKRYINCVNHLKENHRFPSLRQFAITIGVHPQCISDIVRSKREVNSDIIHKTIAEYKINPVYLYTGEGPLTMDETPKENTEAILTIVTDESGEERIVHVPVAAQAGYGNQLNDRVFIEDLPRFSLPGTRFRSSTHRCFDVAGDSMEPTLFSGDQVVCSFIEPNDWINGIRSNYVYVLVTHSSVVVKRVVNNLKKNGCLVLKSDNSFYSPYELELKDVLEVWMVSVKISPFMPSPSNMRNGFHNEVDMLRNTISDQTKLIQSLNSTVEKLLRQNRGSMIR